MSNYGELILEILIEKGKTIKDLERNNILAKNSFYSFSKTAPSLASMIKIANYLELSIDYIVGTTDDNNFKRYKLKQTKFYDNLEKMRSSLNISKLKLCSDLGISRTNFSRWKYGTAPSISKIVDIAKYFECNIDELLETEK